jgi:hypothetical protein
MSYARFGADGSDVYVFMAIGDDDHPGGWLECCWCDLTDRQTFSFRAFTTATMVQHLQEHIDAGGHVPEDVIPSLLADDAQNFPQAPTSG